MRIRKILLIVIVIALCNISRKPINDLLVLNLISGSLLLFWLLFFLKAVAHDGVLLLLVIFAGGPPHVDREERLLSCLGRGLDEVFLVETALSGMIVRREGNLI